MAAETQPQPAPLTFPGRVLGIPLVSSSLDTIHSKLSTSPYTKTVYQTGQSIAITAYGTASRVSSPVLTSPSIHPFIASADGYATKGIDTLHSKFPYAFESSPETVFADLKRAPDEARNVARKTIDEKIKTPAYGLAKDVDHSLTPLVNLLESILLKLHARSAEASSDDASSPSTSMNGSTDVSDKAQITRAKELVLGAKDHIITLTTEQAKALRSQNVYIQRASEHANTLNATVASQYQNAQAGIAAYKGKGVELGKEAQAKVYALGQSMVGELEKIQTTTATLPAQIQATLKPLTDVISSTVVEMKAILMSEEEGVGMSEKATRVGNVVKERIGPVIEQGKAVYAAAVDKFVTKKEEIKEDVKADGTGDTMTSNGTA